MTDPELQETLDNIENQLSTLTEVLDKYLGNIDISLDSITQILAKND